MNFTIVTGASSNHFKTLCQFLKNVHKFEESTRLVVYDLGLSSTEVNYMKETYPFAIYKCFNYDMFPSYLNININAGEYAWKPVIIWETCEEFKGCVLWMDSGNLLSTPLSETKSFLLENGIYSPISSGSIKQWTHPGTIKYLNYTSNLNHQNRNAAICGFNYDAPFIRNFVIDWKNYALIKECIAPEGSSRDNHRQDQAVLSVLYYIYKDKYNFIRIDRNLDGLSSHNDID